MKALGTYKRKVINEDGDLEITFAISNYYSKKECELLQKDKVYSLDIEEKKGRKTLQQNRYFWKLCTLIAEKMNKDTDIIDIYCRALEKASIKFDYIMALPEAEETLKKHYRVVKIIEEREYNGATMYVYQLFSGSSKFNKEQEGKIMF
jgi:hypothetical protein